MSDRTVTWRSYGLVVAGALSYTCLLFVWFSLPAYLSTIIAEVGLSGTEAGLLAGAVPLTYIPLALFSGLAVDRIGPARSLAAGLIVFGLAQIARSVARGFPGLLATTLLIGVGATAITFGLPKLVSVLFPPDRTGLPSSLYLVGSSAGTAAAFGLGRPIIGPALGGWRPLFLWSGVVTLGYAAVWLAIIRLSGLPGGATGDESAFTPGSLGRDIRAVLGHRELRLVVLVGVTYLLIIHGLQGWLPTVLESRGLSAARAGQTTTLLVGANVVGILVVPGLADRFDARRSAIAGSGLVAGLGVVGIITGGATPLAAAGIVAAGLGVGGLSPLVRAIPPSLDGIGERLTGAAVGLVFAVGEVGGFLGPVVIGTLHDATGSYVPGLAVLAGGGLVAMAAGVAMRAA
ncbi:MFS transporter [Halorientalis salina]|uniref:MFS transporter n=1 Tax=Halorientalis salina TaxID=2932266 RepID=UPI002022AA0C|nr:MFS transporter [Halorientalis salina]